MTTEAAGPAPEGATSGGPVASRLRGHALDVYVWTTCLVGVLVILAMARAGQGLDVEPWRLLVVVALCVFADLPLLETRIGHNLESFTFGELCVVLSLALVPTPYGVLIAASCILLFHLGRRISLPKAGFNAANFAISMSAAGGLAHLVAPGELTEASWGSTAGLALGILAFFLINSGGVALAVALSQGVGFASVYRQGLWMRLAVASGNATIALAVIALADWSTATVLVLPPVLASMYASYRGYLHAAAERDVWQQLESATRELNQLDELAVINAAVARSAQLFKADVVAVVIRDAGGTGWTRYVGDAAGLSREDGAADMPGDGLGFVVDGESLTVYATPLDGPRGRIGSLRLGFRGPVQLRSREQQILKTLAHSVSSTLQNARLYTEMRRHAEVKAHQASHDTLTGLGNRALLHDRAVVALAEAQGKGTQCALLIVDLDHFKEINDTLGHGAGDVLLRQVAQRIAAAVPEADVVCRLGGDEFALLIGGFAASGDADFLAARLLRVLSEPVTFDGLRLSIEGSVGVACYPEDAGSFEELLKRADVALYQAKCSRGTFSHYRVARDESSLHRLALAAELRTALAEDQLVVHFQPQYDLRTGSLRGAEALVRWQHPARGLLSPADFVSAVEHSGLVRDFTLAVLDKAVAEAALWSAAGQVLNVAVNLSARNLLDRDLPVDISDVLARHRLPAERLVLEITETTMMSELDVVEDVLARLRSQGIQLSVDDFGTGYSSLAFLQRVQVNEVKVDRSFVTGIVDSENDRALVRATVQLAHSLGARAVGEGVESQAVMVALRDLGCDYVQGFHLGRPVPGEALRTLMGLPDRRVTLPAPRPQVDGRHLRAVPGGL